MLNDSIPIVKETEVKLISKKPNLRFSLVGSYYTVIYIKGGTILNFESSTYSWNSDSIQVVTIVYGKEAEDFFEVEVLKNIKFYKFQKTKIKSSQNNSP